MVNGASTGRPPMAANAMAFMLGIVAPLAGVSWLLTLH
jgi:hypothetical protein